jgi:hypothetical protein
MAQALILRLQGVPLRSQRIARTHRRVALGYRRQDQRMQRFDVTR